MWKIHWRSYSTYGRLPRKLKKKMFRNGIPRGSVEFTWDGMLVTSAPSFSLTMTGVLGVDK